MSPNSGKSACRIAGTLGRKSGRPHDSPLRERHHALRASCSMLKVRSPFRGVLAQPCSDKRRSPMQHKQTKSGRERDELDRLPQINSNVDRNSTTRRLMKFWGCSGACVSSLESREAGIRRYTELLPFELAAVFRRDVCCAPCLLMMVFQSMLEMRSRMRKRECVGINAVS